MGVLPPRNLPGSADKWGREIGNTLDSVNLRYDALESSQGNADRATGGKLSVLSAQVNKLFDRAIQIVRLPETSVTGNRTSPPWPTATIPVTFPSVPYSGSGFLSFQGEVSNTDLGPNSASPRLFIFQDSVLIASGVPNISKDLSSTNPVETLAGVDYLSGQGRVRIDAGQPVDLSIQFIRGYGSVTSTLTLYNSFVTLVRDGI